MGIKQLFNDNLRKLPNEYGDISVMLADKRNATHFVNSSNRNIEILYLLYSNKWINATVLFVVIVSVVNE